MRLRSFIFFWISSALCISSAVAFGQASLIGVNSAAKVLPAGARDVVTSINVDPSVIADETLHFALVPVAVPRGTYKFTLRAKGKTIERTMSVSVSVQ
jgi:hypothetical protein